MIYLKHRHLDGAIFIKERWIILIFLMFSLLTDEQQDVIKELFESNRQYFYNIAYRVVHSEDDAWDAVSTAMVKIIENIDRISNIPCPQRIAFCVTIVKNTSIDIIRKSNKVSHIDNLENITDETVDSFEISYIHKTEVQRLAKIIKQLSYDDKMLIELKFSQDKTYAEIAIMLNINEETTKKRGQRLVKKLKSLYEME